MAGQQELETDKGTSLLESRLRQIRSQPKLQNQQQTNLVLNAVEDTLRSQGSPFTPTAYFAALLSVLSQYTSSGKGTQNTDLPAAVVYLLDLVAPNVPTPLLRTKFVSILSVLAPALSTEDAEASFIKSSIGCLASLLSVQDSQAWALPQSQVSPRQATAILLSLSLDSRPKVRRRAQDSLSTVLANGPPSPSIDHPAADMCAETALRSFASLASGAEHSKDKHRLSESHDPPLIHSLQLIKTIASASGGWPRRSLDSLCEVLFTVARSKSEFLTMTAFDVFEVVFKGITIDATSSKLPRLLEAVKELRPSGNDSQLLPPWIAIISRGYDVSSQIDSAETFQHIPSAFKDMSKYISSTSYNIRVSASECLISFFVNCVPNSAIIRPSVSEERILEELSAIVLSLLDLKYQLAWMEVFNVINAALDSFKWRSETLISKAIATIGDIRSSDTFQHKEHADKVIAKAIHSMGPESTLKVLPLNLAMPASGHQGRAWLLPLIRDSVSNTKLMHFRTELLPLSESLFQKAIESGNKPKTVEIKIFETLVQQIWDCLPGYCNRPFDVTEAFDQSFAELLSKLLYQKPEMRNTICRALQNLVQSFKVILSVDGDEDLISQGRLSKADAQRSLNHISSFSNNISAVLFNVYSETNPQQRGPILSCIDSYLSITKPEQISETFDRVATLLSNEISNAAPKDTRSQKPKQQQQRSLHPPPTSHALMDIVVSIAAYLPRESLSSLFNVASIIISRQHEPHLQKQAYKLIPRLSQSPTGKIALQVRNYDLRHMILQNAEQVQAPARKDRLNAISVIVDALPPADLYFIPCILPEVILRTKETNERARDSAFHLIVQMGEKMRNGGTIDSNKVTNFTTSTRTEDSAQLVPASIQEYFTILSTGLAGTTPHMISATITAIARAFFHFHASLLSPITGDLLDTLDLFLGSPTREIVRSVLGFVKVYIVVLSAELLRPRLESLIPALVNWSHEHKGNFKTKVKNILERLIRRFGAEVVERCCPQADRKLITNIRKTRERRKRGKTAAQDSTERGDDANPENGVTPSHARFENEFDKAIYGSDASDSSDADIDTEDEEPQTRRKGTDRQGGKKNETYIHESASDPLDLLDRKSLANVSTTKPLKRPIKTKISTKSKTDHDGRLVINEDADRDSDADMAGEDTEPKNSGEGMDIDQAGSGSKDQQVDLQQGINAYVDAIRGRDSAQRGRGGKLKFSNRRVPKGRDQDGDGGEGIVKAGGVQNEGGKVGRIENGAGKRGDKSARERGSQRPFIQQNHRGARNGARTKGGGVEKRGGRFGKKRPKAKL